jgi:protoporphyrinogen oxidase
MQKKAIIIGAGPAGLTAAYELLTRTDIIPVILEKSGDIGGISKTVNYKGNRIDIGGHRFFSKSDRVMNWWMNMMPVQGAEEKEFTVSYQGRTRTMHAEESISQEDPTTDPDKVMLVRNRLSRIYFLRKFFAYPIQLSMDTLKKLGVGRTLSILLSYTKARLFPRKPERNLEDFFINRFGNTLYLLFFKDYTEKVWGVSCTQISAEWGAQRIKGISIAKAIAHAAKSLTPRKQQDPKDIGQKGTETSLIEKFLYPKFGPGQLWEEVARKVREMGGIIDMHREVKNIHTAGDKVTRIDAVDTLTGDIIAYEGDFFFSTMPVQELIAGMVDAVPPAVQEVAAGLQYRDFITVGILLKNQTILPDTWIYIQERDVKVGRLQIFNNWSPYMVKDPNTVWMGLEYFCNKTDAFWNQPDEVIKATGIDELEKMNLAKAEDVLDSTVLRMEKTYPAYFGTYTRFDELRNYTDQFANLFLVGRNGMHKYNNSDHSMLTAMVSVDNIAAGVTSKANIWSINTEQEYHEEKATADAAVPATPRTRAKYPFLVDYLWNNRANRTWWLTAMAIFIIQFIIYKFRYPFANYMPDSYSYIDAAASNADVNMWPVAYSKFLRLISVFTHSDKVVVGIQYFFMQVTSLLFLFSLLYFQPPGKGVRKFLLLFLLLNPLPLYIADYISADSLFIGLSLLWLTTLIWIIYRPRPWMIVIHGLLLMACFTVRYNAIYYPVISLVVFVLSRQSWRYKAFGIALGVGLVLLSFLYTSQKMFSVTGKRQFSAFGGWQLANNALYMYEHIPAGERAPVPVRFAKLEKMVREHMDTIQKIKFTADDTISAHFYLWSGRGPLKQYMEREYKKDSTTPYFKKWGSEGPLFADYGMYLIKKYPFTFLKEFMLPNAVKFAVPPTEFLGVYNMNEENVGKLAKDWFNYKTQKVQDRKKAGQTIWATEWYPIFAALVNVMLIMGLIGIIFLNGLQLKVYGLPQLLALVLMLWLLNSGFSIFASPVVLRYQAFPILVAFPVAAFLIERIAKMAFTTSPPSPYA